MQGTHFPIEGLVGMGLVGSATFLDRSMTYSMVIVSGHSLNLTLKVHMFGIMICNDFLVVELKID